MSFDPNDIGVANGNFCGLPVTKEEAELIIIPVPWDATASYGRGTADGPKAILDASLQLDLFHHHYPKVYETKVFMEEIDESLRQRSMELGERTTAYIDFLSEGKDISESKEFQALLTEVNEFQENIKQELYNKSTEYLNQGKKVALLGGEHSTPLGLIQMYADNCEDFGILQIDAHADLRESYEGFEQSHASIMDNALKSEGLKKLVQVGIRDLSEDEYIRTQSDLRIKTFFDWEMKEERFNGKNWSELCSEIIAELPQNIYVSFDIDGLMPAFCPGTGTPVPGGLTFEEAAYLLQRLARSGKNIVGFDLNEVAPGDDVINEIVGARMLMELMLCTMNS